MHGHTHTHTRAHLHTSIKTRRQTNKQAHDRTNKACIHAALNQMHAEEDKMHNTRPRKTG